MSHRVVNDFQRDTQHRDNPRHTSHVRYTYCFSHGSLLVTLPGPEAASHQRMLAVDGGLLGAQSKQNPRVPGTLPALQGAP